MDGWEVGPAAKWIKAQVGNLGGSINGVYLDLIPQDVDLPAVRFHVQDSSDVRVINGKRVITNIIWLIVVVRKGLEVAPLVPIAALLDTALSAQSGIVDGYHIACVREGPFSMLEPDDSGVQYRHAGGLYRTLVGPA